MVWTTDAGWKMEYHLLDHLGSRQVVCDADGEKKSDPDGEVKYSTFGEYDGGAEGEYSYTGKQKDNSTNLVYFNARFYMPEVGRFLTMDPVKAGVNWYVYCGNNPLRYIDPTGLTDEENYDYYGLGAGDEDNNGEDIDSISDNSETTEANGEIKKNASRILKALLCFLKNGGLGLVTLHVKVKVDKDTTQIEGEDNNLNSENPIEDNPMIDNIEDITDEHDRWIDEDTVPITEVPVPLPEEQIPEVKDTALGKTIKIIGKILELYDSISGGG
jgi:RHS repeat-associated protein